MDIGSLSAEEIKAARERLARWVHIFHCDGPAEDADIQYSSHVIHMLNTLLCSRKSFFGGSVTTREEAVAPGYKAKAQTASKAPRGTLPKSQKPTGTGQQARKPAAKRPRDTANEFGDLDDDDDPSSNPRTASKVSKVHLSRQSASFILCLFTLFSYRHSLAVR